MDKVTRDMCVAQLKNADEHPEKPELMRAAIISSMIAVVDCQYSTGKRVKRILAGLVILAVRRHPHAPLRDRRDDPGD